MSMEAWRLRPDVIRSVSEALFAKHGGFVTDWDHIVLIVAEDYRSFTPDNARDHISEWFEEERKEGTVFKDGEWEALKGYRKPRLWVAAYARHIEGLGDCDPDPGDMNPGRGF